MFPVANVPNLHYIIEFLVKNNVKEIIIASMKHREFFKDFAKKQGYKVTIKSVGITTDADNFGDALRQVSEMHIIKDDFILVRGDIITNINIQNALKMHYSVK